MPQKFLLKRSSVENKVPAAGDLETGELALNLKDQSSFQKMLMAMFLRLERLREEMGVMALSSWTMKAQSKALLAAAV